MPIPELAIEDSGVLISLLRDHPSPLKRALAKPKERGYELL